MLPNQERGFEARQAEGGIDRGLDQTFSSPCAAVGWILAQLHQSAGTPATFGTSATSLQLGLTLCHQNVNLHLGTRKKRAAERQISAAFPPVYICSGVSPLQVSDPCSQREGDPWRSTDGQQMLQMRNGRSSSCGKGFLEAGASTAVPVEREKEGALESLASLLYPSWVHKAGQGPPAPLPQSHHPPEGKFPLRPPGSSTGRELLRTAGWEAPPTADLLLHSQGGGATGSLATTTHCLQAAPRAACTHPHAMAPSLRGKCLAITMAPRVPPAPFPRRGDPNAAAEPQRRGEELGARPCWVPGELQRQGCSLPARWPPVGCLSLA